MPSSLSGRVVLVFGAGSSGTAMSNGRAAALAYARAGATVVAIDRDPAQAELTAKEIVKAGGRAMAIAADITDEDGVRDAVDAAAHSVGPPTILHNNVGSVTTGQVTDLSLDRWNAALSLNLTGVFLTCKYTIPWMLSVGRGAIVNVSSLASIRYTGYSYPAYAAGKAGVNQLTVALALEYAAFGIRVNAILPGLIDTPLVSHTLVDDASRETALAARHASSPTGRMGTPQDVANAAVFLASDDAAYINGVCLPVDGGLAARSV
ncbi:SDR family NAD(P)-dependent oxidoreductase [Rhodococcus sp. MEB064]|uniref:SDR family NAD(P)-dependent oxidoreductase n=1 Tax=Rhodococcus sp. MEB064 TaxID=1587522 RepID=UPI0005ABF31F|nr:SDR family NAD(P)-dependent oxidoreductase [Rhodococcus sp. MEB064]KIQ16635.1 3-oxoacyl-ACP reductase [Rhodococcus sp. MEB064]